MAGTIVLVVERLTRVLVLGGCLLAASCGDSGTVQCVGEEVMPHFGGKEQRGAAD